MMCVVNRNCSALARNSLTFCPVPHRPKKLTRIRCQTLRDLHGREVSARWNFGPAMYVVEPLSPIRCVYMMSFASMPNEADVLPKPIQHLAASCVQRSAAGVDEAGVQEQEYRVDAGSQYRPQVVGRALGCAGVGWTASPGGELGAPQPVLAGLDPLS
jgi:hypothetical protein